MTAPAIAVVGASQDRHKFGNKCVRAYLDAGYEVLPVNLHQAEIEGVKVYASLRDIPVPLGRISVYLQPAETRRLLPQLAEYPEVEIWFNPGSADAATLAAAHRLGLRVRDGCSIVDIGRSPSEFP